MLNFKADGRSRLRSVICWTALASMMACSVLNAQDSGSSAEPEGGDFNNPNAPAAMVAQPLITGGPATSPLINSSGFFSPIMGARFEIVSLNVGGRWIQGAQLITPPVPNSPLENKGLIVGDVLTHLDGVAMTQLSELENHNNNTAVTWVAEQTSSPRNFSIFLRPGQKFTEGGGISIVGPPINIAPDVAGLWNCSCGGVWNLIQNGNSVTGDETDATSTNRVTGTFDGTTFRFTYFHHAGYNGTGIFTVDPAFSSMVGSIRWQNGTTSSPVLTRNGAITNIPTRPPISAPPVAGPATTYTVISFRNQSNQHLECQLRWNGGAWENVSLSPRQTWTYWMKGTNNSPQLQYNMDQTGGQDYQVMDLVGAVSTVQGKPTSKDANVYSLHINGGYMGITN